MKNIIKSFLLLTGILLSFQSSYSLNDNYTKKALDLNKALRKLWAEHVIWTRDFVIAALANAPDKKAATDRLLKNQEDIGDAIVPFYGKNAGQQLAKLLKDHILIAAAIVEAAKKGDTATKEQKDTLWYHNADAIAEFLHKANPQNWSLDALQKELHTHLQLLTDEVGARLEKRWKDDAAVFDQVLDQILGLADILSEGIIKQKNLR